MAFFHTRLTKRFFFLPHSKFYQYCQEEKRILAIYLEYNSVMNHKRNIVSFGKQENVDDYRIIGKT